MIASDFTGLITLYRGIRPVVHDLWRFEKNQKDDVYGHSEETDELSGIKRLKTRCDPVSVVSKTAETAAAADLLRTR